MKRTGAIDWDCLSVFEASLSSLKLGIIIVEACSQTISLQIAQRMKNKIAQRLKNEIALKKEEPQPIEAIFFKWNRETRKNKCCHNVPQ